MHAAEQVDIRPISDQMLLKCFSQLSVRHSSPHRILESHASFSLLMDTFFPQTKEELESAKNTRFRRLLADTSSQQGASATVKLDDWPCGAKLRPSCVVLTGDAFLVAKNQSRRTHPLERLVRLAKTSSRDRQMIQSSHFFAHSPTTACFSTSRAANS